MTSSSKLPESGTKVGYTPGTAPIIPATLARPNTLLNARRVDGDLYPRGVFHSFRRQTILKLGPTLSLI